jgi:mono/diheme cytochrome c family protein
MLPRSFRALAFGLLCACGAATAQTNGPMSSGYKATQPSTDPPPADAKNATGELDVKRLFATTCGFCHSNGGRTAGKGPQLMGTTLTDAEITSRIKNGKAGQMPAFATTFSDDDIKAIIRYIRGLKEE